MSFLSLVSLALAPGLFWLWFFARKSRYRPVPRDVLALTFFLGMISTVPAGAMSVLFISQEVFEGSATIGAFDAAMLFIVGPVEELCKFGAARLGADRSMYFEEPLDGLVLSVAASLGFASLENFAYMLQYGPEVIVVRGPLSTLGHVVFGASWGYALGRYIQERSVRTRIVLLAGLLGAAVLHGLFNITAAFSPLLSVPLVALGMAWTLGRFDWGQRVSPFRYRRNYPLVGCGSCGRLIRATSHYCRFCGAFQRVETRQLVFGHCQRNNRPDASFCVRCGDRFLAR